MRRLLALVLLLALAGACSTQEERASGVTERWLQAVSDTGRERLRDDAAERANGDGDTALAASLLAGLEVDHDDDEPLFADLEVGRAVEEGDIARVPFRVTRTDDDEALYRTAVLEREPGGWRVVAIDEPRRGEAVPSRGGARPASASGRHWGAAVAVGILLSVVSAIVIELQPVPAPSGRNPVVSD